MTKQCECAACKCKQERPLSYGQLASKGRFGDTEIGKVSAGDQVVPLSVQTPDVLDLIRETLFDAGLLLKTQTVKRTTKTLRLS